MTAEEIRLRLSSRELDPESALPVVEQALAKWPSAALWVLRGDLIQLATEPIYELDEAARSYEHARVLAPEAPEPLVELAHFYDAVMADLEKAKEFYRAALAKGAGEDCARALAKLLEEETR